MLIISNNEYQPKYNKPLYGLTGTYTLSEGIALPYFLSLLDINRVIDELKIAEQIPASLDTQWSLKELFQREIDEKRVENDIIKGYLLDPKKLKFFNAITIVLMPKGDEGKIQDTFNSSEVIEPPPIPWDATDANDAQWKQSEAKVANFGGVQFISIGMQARLRWDEDKVLAVAVDGQHRLWALSKFRQDKKFRGGTLRKNEEQTTIPVLFVLLHQEAGFQNSQSESHYSIRGIARELFTDLNKNAKTVDKARELILDDKSISAQCVRTLLTESTAKDTPDKLPLSLVRWQDDSNRFDTSYYLNSLVNLDLLISSILDLKPPRDPMEYKQVLSFIESIDSALGIDDKKVQHGERKRSLEEYYVEDYCEDGEPVTPFARIPENYLDSAIQGFKANFRPWLLKLLLEFKPYKNLLHYARTHDLIEGTFGRFQAQTSKHKGNIKEQEISKDTDWHKREILVHQDAIASMKENQWAFKVIFQKAMIRLGKIVEFKHKGKHPNLGNIDDVLTFLDRLYDKGILQVDTNLKVDDNPEYYSFRLWTFVAINPGNDKIKVARAVEDRIFSLLTLWYLGSRKVEFDSTNGHPMLSRRKLLNFFRADSNQAQWPGCTDAYKALYKGFDTNAFYGRDHENMSDDKKEDLVRDRFSAVLVAGLPEVYSKSLAKEVSEEGEQYA